jgi:hypothetical protein
MSSANTPARKAFDIKQPLAAFDEHSRIEIERLRKTSPDFDEALHEQARRLVIARLERTVETQAP